MAVQGDDRARMELALIWNEQERRRGGGEAVDQEHQSVTVPSAGAPTYNRDEALRILEALTAANSRVPRRPGPLGRRRSRRSRFARPPHTPTSAGPCSSAQERRSPPAGLVTQGRRRTTRPPTRPRSSSGGTRTPWRVRAAESCGRAQPPCPPAA